MAYLHIMIEPREVIRGDKSIPSLAHFTKRVRAAGTVDPDTAIDFARKHGWEVVMDIGTPVHWPDTAVIYIATDKVVPSGGEGLGRMTCVYRWPARKIEDRDNPIEIVSREIWDRGAKDSRVIEQFIMWDGKRFAPERGGVRVPDQVRVDISARTSELMTKLARMLIEEDDKRGRTLSHVQIKQSEDREGIAIITRGGRLAHAILDADRTRFYSDDAPVESPSSVMSGHDPKKIVNKLFSLVAVRGNPTTSPGARLLPPRAQITIQDQIMANARPNRTAAAPACALPPTPSNPCPWPIGDEEHAIIAIRYMAGRMGKPADYLKIRDAIIERWETNHNVMVALMAVMAGEGAYKRTLKSTGDAEQAKAAAKVARAQVKTVYKRCAKLVQSHREFARTNPLNCDLVVQHVKKAHLKSADPAKLEAELLRLRAKYTEAEADAPEQPVQVQRKNPEPDAPPVSSAVRARATKQIAVLRGLLQRSGVPKAARNRGRRYIAGLDRVVLKSDGASLTKMEWRLVRATSFDQLFRSNPAPTDPFTAGVDNLLRQYPEAEVVKRDRSGMTPQVHVRMPYGNSVLEARAYYGYENSHGDIHVNYVPQARQAAYYDIQLMPRGAGDYNNEPEAVVEALRAWLARPHRDAPRDNPAPTPAAIEKRAKMHKAVHNVPIAEARVMAAAELSGEWAKVQAADAARFNPADAPRDNPTPAQAAMLTLIIGAGLYTAYVEARTREASKGRPRSNPNPTGDADTQAVLSRRTKKTFTAAAREHWQRLRDEEAVQNFAEIAVERGLILPTQVLAFLSAVASDNPMRLNPIRRLADGNDEQLQVSSQGDGVTATHAFSSTTASIVNGLRAAGKTVQVSSVASVGSVEATIKVKGDSRLVKVEPTYDGGIQIHILNSRTRGKQNMPEWRTTVYGSEGAVAAMLAPRDNLTARETYDNGTVVQLTNNKPDDLIMDLREHGWTVREANAGPRGFSVRAHHGNGADVVFTKDEDGWLMDDETQGRRRTNKPAIHAAVRSPARDNPGRLAAAAGWLKDTVVHGANAEHMQNVTNLLKLAGAPVAKAKKVATAMVKHGSYKRDQLRGLSAQIKDRFESLLRDPQYRNRMAMALRMNPSGGLDAAHDAAARANPDYFPRAQVTAMARFLKSATDAVTAGGLRVINEPEPRHSNSGVLEGVLNAEDPHNATAHVDDQGPSVFLSASIRVPSGTQVDGWKVYNGNDTGKSVLRIGTLAGVDERESREFTTYASALRYLNKFLAANTVRTNPFPPPPMTPY